MYCLRPFVAVYKHVIMFLIFMLMNNACVPSFNFIQAASYVLLEAVCCCFIGTTLFKIIICQCTSPYENLYTRKVSYL